METRKLVDYIENEFKRKLKDWERRKIAQLNRTYQDLIEDKQKAVLIGAIFEKEQPSAPADFYSDVTAFLKDSDCWNLIQGYEKYGKTPSLKMFLEKVSDVSKS